MLPQNDRIQLMEEVQALLVQCFVTVIILDSSSTAMVSKTGKNTHWKSSDVPLSFVRAKTLNKRRILPYCTVSGCNVKLPSSIAGGLKNTKSCLLEQEYVR